MKFFNHEFEMIGLLVRFYAGFFQHESVMKMRFRRDLKMWQENYILQSTEESVVEKLSFDDKGKRKDLPSNARIRQIVLEKIKEGKAEYVKKVLD